jgi:hypothetical protein
METPARSAGSIGRDPMKIRRLASAASVVAALAFTGTAVAHEPCPDPDPPSPCPPGFTPAADPQNNSGADLNGNGTVCGMTTPLGDVFVDDLL